SPLGGLELGRQSEAGEDLGSDERRDLLDERALERQDVDRQRQVTAGVRILAVARPRRLAVNPNRQPAGPGAGVFGLGSEPGDRVASAPPHRPWRHREDRVLGKQRLDGIDIASRPRFDVRVDELADALVAEQAQRLLLTPVGKTFLYRLARTLERAVHRRDGCLQRLRHLARREAEYL